MTRRQPIEVVVGKGPFKPDPFVHVRGLSGAQREALWRALFAAGHFPGVLGEYTLVREDSGCAGICVGQGTDLFGGPRFRRLAPDEVHPIGLNTRIEDPEVIAKAAEAAGIRGLPEITREAAKKAARAGRRKR